MASMPIIVHVDPTISMDKHEFKEIAEQHYGILLNSQPDSGLDQYFDEWNETLTKDAQVGRTSDFDAYMAYVRKEIEKEWEDCK